MSTVITDKTLTMENHQTLVEPEVGHTVGAYDGADGIVLRSNGQPQTTINKLSVAGTIVHVGDVGLTAAALNAAFLAAVGFAPRTGDAMLTTSQAPSMTVVVKRSDGDYDGFTVVPSYSLIS